VSTTADPPVRSRNRWLPWVVHVLVRVVPVLILVEGSFWWLLRFTSFASDPAFDVRLAAMLIGFVPAGVWAVVDGYRYNETREVVVLWAVVTAAATYLPQFYFWGVMLVTTPDQFSSRQVGAGLLGVLPFALTYVIPACALVLVGAWLCRRRTAGQGG
jgi:hypothetical protein